MKRTLSHRKSDTYKNPLCRSGREEDRDGRDVSIITRRFLFVRVSYDIAGGRSAQKLPLKKR